MTAGTLSLRFLGETQAGTPFVRAWTATLHEASKAP